MFLNATHAARTSPAHLPTSKRPCSLSPSSPTSSKSEHSDMLMSATPSQHVTHNPCALPAVLPVHYCHCQAATARGRIPRPTQHVRPCGPGSGSGCVPAACRSCLGCDSCCGCACCPCLVPSCASSPFCASSRSAASPFCASCCCRPPCPCWTFPSGDVSARSRRNNGEVGVQPSSRRAGHVCVSQARTGAVSKQATKG